MLNSLVRRGLPVQLRYKRKQELLVTMSRLVSTNNSVEEQDKFLQDVFDLCMKRAVQGGRDRSKPIFKFAQPDEIRKKLDLGLRSDGADHSELLKLCDGVFDYSVLTGHPYFFNQQIAGLDTYGLAGNLVTDALNTNGHTYEVAPVFTVMELELIEHMQKFVGYSGGEGVFNPGGSYSNMLAMNVARIKRYPETKMSGIFGLPKLISFCSEHAHYSAKKNSVLLGFGQENCVSVKCDSRGKMIPEELEKCVQEAKSKGEVPFFVTGMAGTTVLGAFDPLDEIADICEKHGMWFHIDGAWGGSALLSKKHRHLCKGIERTNSFAWNPHKLMCAPLQCSVLLIKEKGLLHQSHSLVVPYLFHEDKPYDTQLDLGRQLVQCGRRSDALKLWLMWKAKGDAGFEKQIDKALETALYLNEALKKHPNFRLVTPEPEFTNVSFWYIPPSMRGQEENKEFFEKIGKIIPTIKKRMQLKGSLLVGYTFVGDYPTFFRMTVVNEAAEKKDMDYVLAEIERNATDL